MDGMIFAAGLGTRLRPLTNDRPKAMVELAGKPLLGHVIDKMHDAGIEKIVVNIHHYAEQIIEYVNRHYPDKNIIFSDERGLLLDTGGGLLKARPLFTPEQSVLIHNVDILTDLDLREMMTRHVSCRNYATLAVGPQKPGRGFRFNKEGLLKGWENSLTGEQKKVDEEFEVSENYGFCGIHIVSAAFLQNISGQGIFSVIDEYLRQAIAHPVSMFFYEGPLLDLGTPEALAEGEKRMKAKFSYF